ncbi:MAG: penicillin-insensitive murein endopeptidase [Solirubrobacterales bacterium]
MRPLPRRTRAFAAAALVVSAGAAALVLADALPLGDDGPSADRASARVHSAGADRSADGDRLRSASGERAGSERSVGPRIRWRDSVAIGVPEAGSLERGVQLPAAGRTYFTWDPILKRRPNRDWRRWGTDELVRTTLRVLRTFAERSPAAPRVGVGDLSLPYGGDFGPEVSGGIGHATHQNGLDVDLYYPRLDRAERAPTSVDQIDRRLSQALVDLFVGAGATVIYVGPSTGLGGPTEIVQPLVNHDNHLHARIDG